MHRLTLTVDSNGNWHFFHIELVNGLHSQVFKGNHFRRFDRFRHEIRCSTHSDQVNRLVFLNALNRAVPAFRFSNHSQQTGLFEHHICKLVHSGGGGGPGWTNRFIAHRIDGPDVVDKAIGKVDTVRQSISFTENFLNSFVRRVSPGQYFSG